MAEKKSPLNLIEDSFPGFKANVARCEALGFSWPSTPFLEDEEKILSHVGFLDYPMVIEGKPYKVGALHAICTKMSYRKQGLASELIEEILKWAQEYYDYLILFTEIPDFYKKFSFRCIQEYRFHLACQHPKGSQSLRPIISPQDDALFLQCFREQTPLLNHFYVKNNGLIASFNALFATYPQYWSLYFSPALNGIISYEIKDRTLHLFDIIASKVPSLDDILDHLPQAIDEIYFYFAPDCLTNQATCQPYLYDNSHLMVHGKWPNIRPFMISPLSRC